MNCLELTDGFCLSGSSEDDESEPLISSNEMLFGGFSMVTTTELGAIFFSVSVKKVGILTDAQIRILAKKGKSNWGFSNSDL